MEIPISWLLLVVTLFIIANPIDHLRKLLSSIFNRRTTPKSKDQVTSFFETTPNTAIFKCAFRPKNIRCERPICPTNRHKARGLRRTLSIVLPSESEFPLLLRHYARACLCNHGHGKDTTKLDRTVDAWRKELNQQLDTISFIARIAIHIPGSFEACLHASGVSDWSAEHDLRVREEYQALFAVLPPGVEPDSSIGESLDELQAEDAPPTIVRSWFLPYSSKETLEDVIWSELKPKDQEPGYISAYTREETPGYIKIGYTTVEVQTRMERWRSDCKYTPRVLWRSETRIPNARRVETLIHAELQARGLRRRESRCRTSDGCEIRHKEWFKVAEEEAEKVIEYWISWMQIHKPYNNNSQLREERIRDMHLPANERSFNQRVCDFTSDSSGRSWVTNKVNGEPVESSGLWNEALAIGFPEDDGEGEMAQSTSIIGDASRPSRPVDDLTEVSVTPAQRPAVRSAEVALEPLPRARRASHPTVGGSPPSARSRLSLPATPEGKSRRRSTGGSSSSKARKRAVGRVPKEVAPKDIMDKAIGEAASASPAPTNTRGSSVDCPIDISSDEDDSTTTPSRRKSQPTARRQKGNLPIKSEDNSSRSTSASPSLPNTTSAMRRKSAPAQKSENDSGLLTPDPDKDAGPFGSRARGQRFVSMPASDPTLPLRQMDPDR